eukprot:scaffold7.g3756.t1
MQRSRAPSSPELPVNYAPKAKAAKARRRAVSAYTFPLLAFVLVVTGLAVAMGFHSSLPHSIGRFTEREEQQQLAQGDASGGGGQAGGAGADAAGADLAQQQQQQQQQAAAAGGAGGDGGAAAGAVQAGEQGARGGAAAEQQQQQTGTKKDLMQKDIEDLIEEAAQVAHDQGVKTDTGMATDEQLAASGAKRRYARENDNRALVSFFLFLSFPQEEDEDEEDVDLQAVAKQAAAAACKPQARSRGRCRPRLRQRRIGASDCHPHGMCEGGRCRCVVAFSGKLCGHGVTLTWPFFPDDMKARRAGRSRGLVGRTFTTRYELEFILHQGMRHKSLTVWDPNLPAGQRRMIADERMTANIRNLIPGFDMALKGKAYRTCAVVGSSGSLLLQARARAPARKLGGVIDQHTLVIRSNDAPRLGYADWVGTKTNLRVEDAASWGFHEDGAEVGLVHSQTPDMVQGLVWNSRQSPAWAILTLDPDFEDYVRQSFSFEPRSGLFGIMLAIHVCRSVEIFGFGQGAQQGVPYHYYDGCARSPDPARDAAEWRVVRALAESGMVALGEACVLECMHDVTECSRCRVKHNINSVGARQPCRPDKQRQRWQVPWRKEQLAGGGAGGAAAAR